MPKRKDPRGGARTGAGRPRTISANESLALRLPTATKTELAILCDAWQCSKSEAVRQAIEKCAEQIKNPYHGF